MTTVEVSLAEKSLSVAKDLPKWIAGIKTKVGTRILENITADTGGMDRYIECVEIEEIPGAFLCCSFYQQEINDALTRAGLFMGAGKGTKAGTLVAQSDFPLINYKKLVAGHNLPGQTTLDFFAAARKAHDHNAAEKAFDETFVKSARLQKKGAAFYLIGFAIQSMKDQNSVVSHEIFHAHFTLNARYREIVENFWRHRVSAEDRDAVTKEIGRAYNVENEELVMDEFQAYLVQNRAEFDRMKAFVPKYREPLLKEFRDADVELVIL
jgi:hypothetical protein